MMNGIAIQIIERGLLLLIATLLVLVGMARFRLLPAFYSIYRTERRPEEARDSAAGASLAENSRGTERRLKA